MFKKKDSYFLIPVELFVDDYEKIIKNRYFQIDKITDKDKKDFFGVTNIKFNEDKTFSFEKGTNKFNMSYEEYINTNYFTHKLYKIICKLNFFIKYKIINGDENISKIFLAFRLYKTGRLNFIVGMYSNNPGTLYIHPTLVKDEGIYKIQKKEIKNILKLYEKILSNYDEKNFYFDLFNSILDENTTIHNSYFNCVSLIEGLVVNGNNEVSFKFSLYSSYLLNILGQTSSFEEMNMFYKNRSNIAHGKKLKINANELLKLINYTRIILKYYVENNFYVNIEEILLKKLKINKI